MIPIKTSLSIKLKNKFLDYIANLKWYRQVGDIKFLYLSVPCFGVFEQLPFQSFFIQGRKTFEGYYSTYELNKQAREFLEKNKTTTKLIDDYAQLMKSQFAAIKNAVKSVKGMDKLKLAELQKKIRTIDEKYYHIWSTDAFLPDKFDPTGNELLQEEIQTNGLSLSQEEFDKLIKPIELTYIEAERLDLVSIPIKNKSLESHAKKWSHVKNSLLQARFLTAEDFRKDREACKDIEKEKKYLEGLGKQTKKQIQEFYKKYNISKEMQNVFHVFRTLSEVRDARKEVMIIMVELYASYAKRLAKEFNVQPQYFDNATSSKILAIQTKMDVESLQIMLKKRQDGILLTKYKNELYILTEAEAKEIIVLLHKKLLEAYTEIKGMVACKTNQKKIIGKVRVVMGDKEFSLFKEGEILVAGMTRPEYIPLMKKAKAIITDEGGLTCHAAVVSRELGVPCIIGTQVATKKLKDGAIVELDLEEGRIRVID